MSDVLVRRDGKVATITFNRPERRNAMSLGLMRGFNAALVDLAADDGVAAVIVTGAGDQAFGAGLDVKEASTLSAAQHAEQHGLYEGFQRRMIDFPKPLVAAVEGVAAGASLQVVLHCDLVVAGEGARFGMPELSAGRPAIMGSYLLWSRLGPGAAARMALGQDWFDAQEAVAVGLASKVVAKGEALTGAQAYAGKLAATAPKALAATLSWLREMRNGRGAGFADAKLRADAILPDAAASDEAKAADARFAGGTHG
jgi:enoyl-CoA hydratase/carnithine racemase